MNTLIVSLLLACGGAQAPHSHPDEHHAAAAATGGPIEAPLGAYTARLEPSAGALTLMVVDAKGKPVAAEGEARVMLTGTGEEPQRVVLTASGNAWTGDAKTEGAPGYLAVVNVRVAGHQESARLTWGEVATAEPAPRPHDHDHGEHGHEH